MRGASDAPPARSGGSRRSSYRWRPCRPVPARRASSGGRSRPHPRSMATFGTPPAQRAHDRIPRRPAPRSRSPCSARLLARRSGVRGERNLLEDHLPVLHAQQPIAGDVVHDPDQVVRLADRDIERAQPPGGVLGPRALLLAQLLEPGAVALRQQEQTVPRRADLGDLVKEQRAPPCSRRPAGGRRAGPPCASGAAASRCSRARRSPRAASAGRRG